ncbi:hypothetical protein [Kitasatospora sp. GP82]|uniref:hypothetical protein n=1 Tax=Kitasatospora sp. GP82 TaxID=3035089 RepID=UPI002475BD1A|nr:hypothetical protein [Kitasatospora sp. GP82]MDH6128129.1 hypothetical protein [Kitasatospora sp. GP82]
MVQLSGAGRRAALVAVTTAPEDLDGSRLSPLAPEAGGPGEAASPGRSVGIEVRADLVGDPDPHRLRRYVDGPLTYTLRTRRQGGRYDGGAVERRGRLLCAAAHWDLVDLQWRLRLRGLTVTSPHKEAAVALADRLSPAARAAGAAAVLWCEDGGWHADTTDTTAVLHSLGRLSLDPAGSAPPWSAAVVPPVPRAALPGRPGAGVNASGRPSRARPCATDCSQLSPGGTTFRPRHHRASPAAA